jgi:hypothetical protein
MSRRSNPFGVGIVGLPVWADYTALPAGKFIEFTLNTPNEIRPTQYPNVIANHMFTNWSSAAYVPEFGMYGAVGYHGGGVHDLSSADPVGVIVLDLGARTFTWRNQSPTQRYPWKVQSKSGEATDSYGHYQADGLSQTPHVYNCVCPVPAAWGLTGPSGGIARVGENGGDSSSLGAADSWASTTVFDIAQITGGHQRITGADIHGSSTYYFGGNNPSFQQQGASCLDLQREGWWTKSVYMDGGYHNFTHKSGEITKITNRLSQGANYPVLHHFAGPDVLVCMGNQTHQAHVWICRPDSDTNWTTVAPVFGTMPLTAFYPGFMGMRWSTLLNCFVGIEYHWNISSNSASGTSLNVWKLVPPSPLTWATLSTGTWTWIRETVMSADGSTITINEGNQMNAAYPNGSWGKLVECPPLRALVWTHRANRKGQLIRLAGM